ncbi:MAG: NUDIX hydrolase [Parcubacteria group bacterium]|nr:NUDIX hydrolase [Parcubacteria group bacterium]
MEMHIIQKHILKKLSENKVARYAQIKPPHIEGNQFSYHLKTLIRRGYVCRKGAGYALTTKGLHHATQVTFEHFSIRMQPRIATLIVCKNTKNEYLVYTRKKQPFLNMDGFPFGKVHLGEKITDAVERELQEKTGLTAQLKQKGIMYLLVTDAAHEVIAHTLFHVFVGTKLRGDLLPESSIGSMRWLSEKELMRQPIMPGVLETLRIAKNPSQSLVFEEYAFEQA